MSVALKRPIQILLMLFVIVSPALRAQADGCSRTLSVGWTDIPPAFFRGPDRAPVGVDIDILKAVLAAANCRFETRHMPFKRYIEGLRFGTLDIVMLASKNPEREQYAYFSPAYRRERMVLFTTPDRQDLLATTDLAALSRSGATLAIGLGVWLGPDFAALYDGDAAFREKVLLIDTYPASLRALLAGRIDAMVGDSVSVNYRINEMELAGWVVQAPLVVHDNDVYFMFSRKAVPQADVDRINAALDTFIGSPDYMGILNRYPVGDPADLVPTTLARD